MRAISDNIELWIIICGNIWLRTWRLHLLDGIFAMTTTNTERRDDLLVQDFSLEEAWKWVNREFPFKDYIPSARKSSYFEMPKAVLKRLTKGASILDFGAES